MTQDEQEQDLELARSYFNATKWTVDRCRHETVDHTSLWIFDGKKQIASMIWQRGEWKVNRLRDGMCLSERFFASIRDCIRYLYSYEPTR
jgi:hypothetical protein